MSEPFSEASLRLAGEMLRLLLTEPSERERIDALAALCNAAFAMKRERPKQWRAVTTHDWTGRPL